MKRDEYKRVPRIGWAPSSNAMRISIPDSFHFPHSVAYLTLRDPYTVRLSPNASANAVRAPFMRDERTAGCRFVQVQAIKIAGSHFRIAPVLWRVDGDDLVLDIPAEEDRIPPKRSQHAPEELSVPMPADLPAEPAFEVDETEILVPVTVMGFSLVPMKYQLPEELAIKRMLELSAYEV